MAKIDYNRGVIKRIHPTGIEVYMYRDTPGHYLNAFGSEVGAELAKAAGFDTERYGKARLRGERMGEAMKIIEAELASGPAEPTVVEERAGFQIVDIGLGRFRLVDPDGGVLTTTPVPREMADLLLDQLAPPPSPQAEPAVEEVEAAPKAKGKVKEKVKEEPEEGVEIIQVPDGG